VGYKNKRIPVPRTGGRRTYYKTYYRTVKTANEARQYYACEDKSLIRCARTPLHLPDSWDDVDRCREKNWKRQSKRARQHGYNQIEIRKFWHVCYEEI